ncbi:Hsp20/alpha crystallin family protein [Halomonas koreensis]|uniref:Hsp20/alpha crystallin family protein n=1 Tax=Halomonas koreensis TaxID=245385 RepID=A0ABU1G7E4_9GAMM|nr:Hsp20/alpha crystallin family protein [Halomonas koreensis]MDR5868443.1 Hsp20/alpha crystallin family protein [Halomonas koreensis]
MFGDLRRFDTDWTSGGDWFRRFVDELWPEPGAADIRSVPRGSFPRINVGRTDDAVRVYVFAPGLAPDALEVSLQDNVLTVSGRRPAATEPAPGERRTRFRRERATGEFSRSVALPEGLDPDRAEARFRHGVCEVVLPKREELKPRRIDIQAS